MFAGLLAPILVQANVITFGGYSGSFPYVENGLTVSAPLTPADGNWTVSGPATVGTTAHLSSPNSTSGGPGTLAVGGAPFYFSSVDLAAGPAGGQIYGPLSFLYTITGSLNGATVFSASGSVATLSSYSSVLWNSVTGNPLAVLDRLTITFTTTANGGVDTVGYALRNLNVTAVPDTTVSASLLGFSVCALALFRRGSTGK